VDGGVVSTALVDEAAVGDPVTWTGPLGTFGAGYSAAADPHDPGAIALVVVAGGSGITPILSVLRARLASDPCAPTLLVFANRGYRSVMFRAELAALQAVSPGLTVEHVLERASRRLGGHAGRLDEMRIANLVGGWLAPRAKDVRALLCGPEGLMDVAHAGLRVAGLTDDAVERERFAPAAAALDDAVGATWSVSLPGHGVLLQVRDDQTVLEAARAAGVPLRWSCGMGGCGACRLTCVSGAVAHDAPNCLSADELKAGATLTCVARPRSPIELVDD
jgi:ferredoxin-NADP reductase